MLKAGCQRAVAAGGETGGETGEAWLVAGAKAPLAPMATSEAAAPAIINGRR